MNELQLIYGDARKIPLPDESVQCIVTSPPYWGLRKYAGEQELIWTPEFRRRRPVGTAAARLYRTEKRKRKEKIAVCQHEFVGAGQSYYKPDRGTVGKDANGSGLIGGERGTQASKLARGEIVQYGGTCRLCGVWRGAFGLEPTIEMYVAHTVEILRELRRVLRSDGVVFWNIGDSYAGGGNGCANYPGDYPKQNSNRGALTLKGVSGRKSDGLKPKDLCLVPARIALAAQADGWWVRSLIIWAKPNPMPESVGDRPTDSYEHILMLTKSERYFWDAEAVREPHQDKAGIDRFKGNGGISDADYENRKWEDRSDGLSRPPMTMSDREYNPAGRNLRNVWNFPTQPYSGAHFATFPEEIPRRCILAATSARGCCQQCGAPWERVARKQFSGDWNPNEGSNGPLKPNRQSNDRKNVATATAYEKDSNPGRIALLRQQARESGVEYVNNLQTIGWAPTCRCRGQRGKVTPCLVLDPFGGSGTTGKVAIELARRAVLVDIAYGEKDSYRELAERRTSGVQRPLLAEL